MTSNAFNWPGPSWLLSLKPRITSRLLHFGSFGDGTTAAPIGHPSIPSIPSEGIVWVRFPSASVIRFMDDIMLREQHPRLDAACCKLLAFEKRQIECLFFWWRFRWTQGSKYYWHHCFSDLCTSLHYIEAVLSLNFSEDIQLSSITKLWMIIQTWNTSNYPVARSHLTVSRAFNRQGNLWLRDVSYLESRWRWRLSRSQGQCYRYDHSRPLLLLTEKWHLRRANRIFR